MTPTTTKAIKMNINIVRPGGAFLGAGSVIASPVSSVSARLGNRCGITSISESSLLGFCAETGSLGSRRGGPECMY
jgi:hypothetical protein